MIAVLILFLLWASLRPNSFLVFVINFKEEFGLQISIIFGLLVINLLPDYLSLRETRWLLSLVNKKPSFGTSLGLLTLDFILTLVIFIFGFSFFLFSTAIFLYFLSWAINIPAGGSEGNIFNYQFNTWLIWLTLILEEGIYLGSSFEGSVSTGILLYSTFFTSVWLWLYLLSSFGLRLLIGISFAWEWLKTLFDIETKPILSLGALSIVIVTLVFIAGLPVLLVVSK